MTDQKNEQVGAKTPNIVVVGHSRKALMAATLLAIAHSAVAHEKVRQVPLGTSLSEVKKQCTVSDVEPIILNHIGAGRLNLVALQQNIGLVEAVLDNDKNTFNDVGLGWLIELTSSQSGTSPLIASQALDVLLGTNDSDKMSLVENIKAFEKIIAASKVYEKHMQIIDEKVSSELYPCFVLDEINIPEIDIPEMTACIISVDREMFENALFDDLLNNYNLGSSQVDMLFVLTSDVPSLKVAVSVSHESLIPAIVEVLTQKNCKLVHEHSDRDGVVEFCMSDEWQIGVSDSDKITDLIKEVFTLYSPVQEEAEA